ncbi:alpha/beta fold hydrolase [Pelagibaculum spongiae]|uniref:Alpha/beta hydrolase n=1 Tax=Pelagibaculum spongiae TaxID=2080658 RepID=A0A2V1GQ67_9GAMM|nr:alpha/beta hydrolase [Pelagibaculum spongiae]PVZ64971.1 alpha/beta hydrolase [Pelagibaculum spongiae]
MNETGPLSKTLKLAHTNLKALCWGDPADPPLLAIHGWLDNANSFRPLAPLIDNYFVVAIDLPGHGRSDHRPEHALYHFTDYVADVYQIAEFLGWSKFSILGHSMGAGIASLFAGTFADRVDKLLLIEGLGPLSIDENDLPALLAQSVTQRFASSAKKRSIALDKAIRARVQASPMKESSARLLLERGLQLGMEGWQWRSDSRLRLPSPWRMSEAQVAGFLTAISAKTLLITAIDDELWKGITPQTRLEQVADLTHLELPGRHHLHMDYPEQVAELINQFLSPQDVLKTG